MKKLKMEMNLEKMIFQDIDNDKDDLYNPHDNQKSKWLYHSF